MNAKNLIKGATGDWEVVIGMEVHAQVTSQSKLFSGASTEFGGAPNSHVSLVDAAMPGMLPVINEECVKQAIRTGLGLKAKINYKSVFDRKNYFYPDAAKNYQVTQYDKPSTANGYVDFEFNGEIARVRITRAHLEEDVGKNSHFERNSGVDFNRAGVPLLEIVSEPDITSSDMAYEYLNALKDILVYGGISDAETLEDISQLCGTIVIGEDDSRTIRTVPPELIRALPDWRALVLRMNLSPVIIKFRPAWKRPGLRFGRRPAPLYVPRLGAAMAEGLGLDETMPLELTPSEPEPVSGDFPFAGSLTRLTGSGGDD